MAAYAAFALLAYATLGDAVIPTCLEGYGKDWTVEAFLVSEDGLGLDVALYSLTFRKIRQAHVASNGEGCDKALDPRNGFGWDWGVDFCH